MICNREAWLGKRNATWPARSGVTGQVAHQHIPLILPDGADRCTTQTWAVELLLVDLCDGLPMTTACEYPIDKVCRMLGPVSLPQSVSMPTVWHSHSRQAETCNARRAPAFTQRSRGLQSARAQARGSFPFYRKRQAIAAPDVPSGAWSPDCATWGGGGCGRTASDIGFG